MIGMLAHRTLGDRPRRTAMLLLGLGIAVGVMITLLSIGEAVLIQAQDKNLVGGGDVLVLPAGIDVEVMKIGGSTGMYAMLDNARFLYRQILSGPRFAASLESLQPPDAALPLAAASPGLIEKVLYVRKISATAPAPLDRDPGGASATPAPVKVIAHGFIPSLDVAVAGPTTEFLHQGIPWEDSPADRMWVDPPVDSLYNEMDRFHLPARGQGDLDRWAEWLYFNFTDPVTGTFGYVSTIVGNDIEAGLGRGGPLLQIKRPGEPPRKFSVEVPVGAEDISLERVDLRLGDVASAMFRDGAYRVALYWRDAEGPVQADLFVRPVLDLYYPPFLIHESEHFLSGYTVPALRTRVSGSIRVPGLALELQDAPGYHDHNWGTWRSVSWEWGTASSPEYALLYGRVQHPEIDPGRSGAGYFLMLSQARSATQRGGSLGLFRPREITYAWRDTTGMTGNPARVPTDVRLQAIQENPLTGDAEMADRMQVRLDVQEISSTEPREGEELVFLQLQGRYTVEARIGGREIRFSTPGFAEVFVPQADAARSGSPREVH
jgi:hypothetical protein